jgi:hypothetical protein
VRLGGGEAENVILLSGVSLWQLSWRTYDWTQRLVSVWRPYKVSSVFLLSQVLPPTLPYSAAAAGPRCYSSLTRCYGAMPMSSACHRSAQWILNSDQQIIMNCLSVLGCYPDLRLIDSSLPCCAAIPGQMGTASRGARDFRTWQCTRNALFEMTCKET